MNTHLLKNTVSFLGIITTIIAFGNLKANAEITPRLLQSILKWV